METDPPPPPPDDADNSAETAGAKRPAANTDATTDPAPNKKKATVALQQQIQEQLQQQLQQQLQAAAARGQQANITPEQIQAQAAAMVQAAAQAQAVVAAAKTRGDGLQPMNAQQIAALSQIQAAAIVNARSKQNANVSQSQIQTQIQLQAQALVHAHTQAQIQAGIYKGGGGGEKGSEKSSSTAAKPPPATVAAVPRAPAAPQPATNTTSVATITLTQSQAQQLSDLKAQLAAEKQQLEAIPGVTDEQRQQLEVSQNQKLVALHEQFRRQNAAINLPPPMFEEPPPDSNSPAFQAQLKSSLQEFWTATRQQIANLHNQTEQDFKNHNDLPLARIKRIMKSDEDVRMISAEAPVLFAKACELFILDLSIRSWNYSQLHKRRTLQKEDVKETIQKTDIFDFLVDVIQ